MEEITVNIYKRKLYRLNNVKQMTHTWFQVVKQRLGDSKGEPLAFYKRAMLAGFAGACGGFVGTPGDMINVRMQNDIKLPVDQRRK